MTYCTLVHKDCPCISKTKSEFITDNNISDTNCIKCLLGEILKELKDGKKLWMMQPGVQT